MGWYFLPAPVVVGFMLVAGWILKPKSRRIIGFVAVLAGVTVALFGGSSGLVLGPFFIRLVMQPNVASSSRILMIFWTAFSGVVQYVFAGELGWQFILYGVVIGLEGFSCCYGFYRDLQANLWDREVGGTISLSVS